MTLRTLILTTGLLGLLLTNTVLALGLGEIKLNSSLNEPLDAEVQLTSIGELTDIEILVGLGSPGDFKNAGVERLFLLTDLNFSVDLANRAQPVLRITSKKPIREPYLNFLVEVQWPTGRLVREYTLLLDLPVYASEKTAAKKIEAASSGPQLRSNPTTPKPVSDTPSSQSAVAGDGQYSVNAGDTVWAIAQRIRPRQATMNQTMAAIKQLNPDAFINDNINLLKKGAVLRLPEGSDIRALTQTEVRTELSQPESIPAKEDEALAPVLDATEQGAAATDSAVAGEGRLKLAALGTDDASEQSTGNVNGDGQADGSSGSGQDELIAAQEELDKTLRENDDLKTRIANLEEQLSTMNRLVEIQDDSLRGTQLAVQAEEPSAIEEPSAQKEPSALKEPAASDVEANTVAEPASTQGGQGDRSLGLAGWMDYLLYPLIALLALLLAVVMFFRNRKNDDDDQGEVSLQTLATPKESEYPEENLAETFTETEKQYVHEVAAELDESDLKDLEELELGDGEGVDPKGEADIYLSLGNYRQAENILRKAIEADPQDSSLRLKLLEVHVNANNPDAFEADKASLAELNDSQADARALALEAELLPGKSDSPDDSDVQADISSEIPDTSVGSADFEAPTLDYDLGDVSPNASLEDDTYPKDEESVTPSADRDLNDIDLFASGGFSAEESSADKVSADDGLTATSPDTQPSAGEAEPDFDLDLDLEDMDLGALSTEIDEGMQNIDFDEEGPAKEEDEQAEPRTENDGFDDLASVEDSLGDDDESDTKLVLAEAYVDMGDPDNARDLLEEVLQSGTEEQRKKANDLLETLS
ncbi:FimV/HubP family polar landmark protein [Porticoccus sp.]|uniref:FimV/HubP family polar landmark protein n=1 Tax=Porticoccus sp. TaxID=2024853 RepID=UPI000C520B71|nr:FimV/HubP family polar landmark protein [Porticoccus sp.]MAZ71428.1 hypothetical protein [Porticoccus sp.]|tara:strand:+ start:7138 stop:9594 length:2457 start_codon:yes stop_codon:yes gene_type:complete